MDKIREAMYKSELPKLEIKIDRFRHKKTGEIRWCVMCVSTALTERTHMFIYDASEWQKIDSEPLEGVSRIQDCYDADILIRLEEKELENNK